MLFRLSRQSEASLYDYPNAFECLPCAEGCDSCEDASPCVAELNWPMRTSILILACAIIGFLPPAAVFTFRYQQVKVRIIESPVANARSKGRRIKFPFHVFLITKHLSIEFNLVSPTAPPSLRAVFLSRILNFTEVV